MKRIAILLAALVLWTGAEAQETTPPLYQGADAQHFMSRLIGETMKLAREQKIPADQLSPKFIVGFTIDTKGEVEEWRFLDNTCTGRDSVELAPATEKTRELVTKALDGLEKWTPAQKEGEPTSYRWKLTMRLPIEKLATQQETDPLLFLGGNPKETFYPWAKTHIHYDERYAARGVAGIMIIKFFVEPDGRITVGQVVESPDKRLENEVIRVIKRSKGKWTPRKVRGVPQRTPFEYRMNFT